MFRYLIQLLLNINLQYNKTRVIINAVIRVQNIVFCIDCSQPIQCKGQGARVQVPCDSFPQVQWSKENKRKLRTVAWVSGLPEGKEKGKPDTQAMRAVNSLFYLNWLKHVHFKGVRFQWNLHVKRWSILFGHYNAIAINGLSCLDQGFSNVWTLLTCLMSCPGGLYFKQFDFTSNMSEWNSLYSWYFPDWKKKSWWYMKCNHVYCSSNII